MTTKAKKSKKISLMGLVSLYLISFAYMSDLVVIPAANDIYTHFSNAPISVLNFILTGSQIMAFLSGLLVPVFLKRFRQREILIASFGLFTVAACLGAVIDNAYYVAAMRAVAGFAFGVTLPAAMDLLTEIYADDEYRRSRVVGNFQFIMTLIGAAMAIIAGIVSSSGWKSVYSMFIAAIPMLILMVIFIPGANPVKAQAGEAEQAQDDGRVNGGGVTFLLISLMIVGLLFNLMNYQCSMYIVQTGIGDSMLAGVVSSISTSVAAVPGLLFAPIYKRIKTGVGALMFLILALSFVVLNSVMGAIWACIGFALIGLAYGFAMPFFFMHVNTYLPAAKSSLGMGLVSAGIALATFLSSYFGTFVMYVFGWTEIISMCPLFIGICAVFLVIYLVMAFAKKSVPEAAKNEI